MVNAAQTAVHRSVNWRIFADTLTVGTFLTLVKLAGAVKVIAMARFFGTADALDAFLIALVVPSFVAEVAAGSLSPALIPTFIEVRDREGRAVAERLYSSVLLGSSASLAVLAGAMAIWAGSLLPLLGSGFHPDKLALTRKLFLLLLPWLPLSGLLCTWRAVLNAHERFALPAGAPVITPALTIGLLFTLSLSSSVQALWIGAIAGVALEAGLLAWGVHAIGLPVLPRWSGWSPELRQVLKQYAPVVAGGLIFSGAMVVDQAMAAMLGPGSVSALTYGTKLATVILTIAATALSTAVLPHFSQMTAARDWRGIRHTLRTYSWLVVAIGTPVTASLMYFSAPLVKLFFQGGAFTAAATAVVAHVQSYSLVRLPLAILLAIALKLASSMKANRLLFQVAALGFIVNVAADYALMQQFGVAGIALASALVNLVSLVYLSYLLFRRMRRITP